MSSSKGNEKLTFCGKVDRQCRSFANFAYNKETGEVMGRSGSSWGKIGLFYLAYYGFLAAFFSSCLAIFLSMLNEPGKGGPKTTQFLIGDSAPGLNALRNPDVIKKYLDGFNNTGYTGPACKGDSTQQLCKFNLAELLKDCGKHPYGTKSNFTCVFVKMNKVYDWRPKKSVGLKCTGAVVEVLPKDGYLADGFPFRGQAWYQTPPVAVKIPQVTSKVTIKCELQSDEIKTSDVFIAHRAYGKIQFDVSP